MARKTDTGPGSGKSWNISSAMKEIKYSAEPSEIEDYDRLIKCWGKIHILNSEKSMRLDEGRSMHIYEFECDRVFQTEQQINNSQYYNSSEKPKNACPGCAPSMEEIDTWR